MSFSGVTSFVFSFRFPQRGALWVIVFANCSPKTKVFGGVPFEFGVRLCLYFIFILLFFFVRRQSLLIFVFPKECVSIRGQRVERVLKVKEYRVMRGGHCGF